MECIRGSWVRKCPFSYSFPGGCWEPTQLIRVIWGTLQSTNSLALLGLLSHSHFLGFLQRREEKCLRGVLWHRVGPFLRSCLIPSPTISYFELFLEDAGVWKACTWCFQLILKCEASSFHLILRLQPGDKEPIFSSASKSHPGSIIHVTLVGNHHHPFVPSHCFPLLSWT